MAEENGKSQFPYWNFIPWVVATVTVLSANWASTIIWDLFKDGDFSWGRAFSLAFFVLMVFFLYLVRKGLFRPRTRELRNVPAEKRKHLVLFLSNLNPAYVEKGIPKDWTLANSLSEDITMMENRKKENPQDRWAWEMPLRALKHHREKQRENDNLLESVTIICSEKSIKQVHEFRNICKQYSEFSGLKYFILSKGPSRLLDITDTDDGLAGEEGLNFESFDDLSDALWHLLRKLKKRKYKEQDIMIDFTGGQKPSSVVAASITFNRKVKAQYVQTDPDYEVLSYNVVLTATDTGGLGL